MNEQIKNVLASYGRSVLAGASALYMAGVTDPKDLAYSLVAAVIPVALRAVNPNDSAFGKLPSVEDVDIAARTAVAKKKATAKKAPVKKTAKKKTSGGGSSSNML
jgi:hypothetical protein